MVEIEDKMSVTFVCNGKKKVWGGDQNFRGEAVLSGVTNYSHRKGIRTGDSF